MKLQQELEETISELETVWDYPSIRYETVMTLKQWNEFVNHPERKPYKSKLNIPDDLNAKYEYGLHLLKKSLAGFKREKKKK